MRIFSYPRRAGIFVGCALAAVLLVTVASQAGTWLDPNGGTITAPDMVVHTDGASDGKLHMACDSGCSGSSPITSVVSAAGEASHVFKAAAGTLFTACAVNLTTTPGYLIVLNATSAPVDGAVTPLDVAPLPGSGSGCVTYNPAQGRTYSTGITAVVTSAATPFTKTTGVITAFINGGVL